MLKHVFASTHACTLHYLCFHIYMKNLMMFACILHKIYGNTCQPCMT